MTGSTFVPSFWKILKAVKASALWSDMERTVEDSPWHREANVALHTTMMLDFYESTFEVVPGVRVEWQRQLSKVCCLFHDVGKPAAEVVKFKEERGNYRAYHGHELISARMWTDWALKNRDLHGYALVDISNIAFMIEHHVPFAMTDPKKRQALKNGIINRVGIHGHQAWLDFLESDQNGRSSDDKHTKLANFYNWKAEWEAIV